MLAGQKRVESIDLAFQAAADTEDEIEEMVTTRLTLAALALLSAAVAAHNFSPRTSAELVAMLEELRSGDQISLQEMTYLLPAPLTLSNLHSIKIKGKGDGKTILDGAGKTRIMELNEVQDIAITGIVFKHGNADVRATPQARRRALPSSRAPSAPAPRSRRPPR